MTRRTLIIDTETTGLDAHRHEIWELAVVEYGTAAAHLWRMKPDLTQAEPQALSVGRYYERTADMCPMCRPERVHDLTLGGSDKPEWSGPEALAAHVAQMLDGATIVAANPTFDAGFLSVFLSTHGQAATWHYRLRDIGSMAWGWLCGRNTHEYASVTGRFDLPPLDAGTDDLARLLGIDLTQFDRHSALGDCRLVEAMLKVIEGGAP